MIKIILVFLAATVFVQAQSYTEKLIAAVIMAEAWGEGKMGMEAVAEVIYQRSLDFKKLPLAVVTENHKGYYVFSCLNRISPENLICKYEKYTDYKFALSLAKKVCEAPHTLTKWTKQANHYVRFDVKPYWVKNKKPVAVIKNHVFYRLN